MTTVNRINTDRIIATDATIDTGTASANISAWTTIANQPNNFVFRCGNREMIRLEPNGDIFVRGELIKNDMEVITLFEQYLRMSNNRYSVNTTRP